MTHLPWQPPGPRIDVDADVVVVGSGAGGAAAASTLSRAGLSVVIVEAGAWRDPEHLPADFYGTMRDLFDDWQSTVTVGPALWPIIQARAVGGTTTINSAICVRTPDEVIDEWVRDHGLDAELHRRELHRHQEALERELHVTAADEATIGRHNQLALQASRALSGDEHAIERYVDHCAGDGRCMLGCRAGHKQSLDRSFVAEVDQAGGTVLSCAPVARVDLHGRRAIGVSGHFVHPRTRRRGAPFRVRARRAVVVAASATHTPVLLRRSGLRHRALGAGFRAHPGAGVLGVYDEPVDLHIGATQGWSSLAWRDQSIKLETLSLPLQMLAARVPGGGTALMRNMAESRHLAHFVLGLRAQAVGRVHAGPGGKPIVRYRLGKHDLFNLRRGLHLLAQHHVAAGATAVLPGLPGIPSRLAPDQIDRILEVPLRSQRFLCILSHLFGGAVMGADDRRSVCDPRGRVWGHEGLVVACAAAIPSTLGVNPQHTIMALARMRAEEIADDRVVRSAA